MASPSSSPLYLRDIDSCVSTAPRAHTSTAAGAENPRAPPSGSRRRKIATAPAASPSSSPHHLRDTSIDSRNSTAPRAHILTAAGAEYSRTPPSGSTRSKIATAPVASPSSSLPYLRDTNIDSRNSTAPRAHIPTVAGTTTSLAPVTSVAEARAAKRARLSCAHNSTEQTTHASGLGARGTAVPEPNTAIDNHPFFARFEGPAPPEKSPSTKAGQASCKPCKTNLKLTRVDINRRYANYKKNKRKKQLPDRVRPQHNYNTRSKRPRPEKRVIISQSANKRIRLSPPPQGTDIQGVNFPT